MLTRYPDALKVQIDEPTCPFFQRMPRHVSGEFTLNFSEQPHHEERLDVAGAHRWMGVAPRARIKLMLDAPALCFEGSAYHDMNWGEAPLEEAFDSWTWSRAELPEGTLVLYDVAEHAPSLPAQRALWFDQRGRVEQITGLEAAQLKRGFWGVDRSTRADVNTRPHIAAGLMDSPFYTRDLIETQLRGTRVTSMHESLNMRRFQSAWVRALIPFRMRIR